MRVEVTAKVVVEMMVVVEGVCEAAAAWVWIVVVTTTTGLEAGGDAADAVLWRVFQTVDGCSGALPLEAADGWAMPCLAADLVAAAEV